MGEVVTLMEQQQIDKEAETTQEQPQAQNNPSPNGLDREVLRQAKYFDAVLTDGEALKCKLIQWGTFMLHVETESARLLIPKRSVKYYVLEKYED